MTNENTDLAELRESLHDQAIADHLGSLDLRTHPVLPDVWPPNGKVRVYGHRTTSLPTGIIKYRLWSSSHYVTIDLETGTSSLHPLETETVLGDVSDMGSERDNIGMKLRDGEEALLAACLGEDPEGLRPRLEIYLQWIETVPLLADEMRAHAPGFFRWLEMGRKEMSSP